MRHTMVEKALENGKKKKKKKKKKKRKKFTFGIEFLKKQLFYEIEESPFRIFLQKLFACRQ